MKQILVMIGLAILPTSPIFAQSFNSHSQQVPLIELYTSEGCNSCPPADRWMSSLLEQPRLWKDFVPVVFHVDYWDYLGWSDRFASKQYSQRQRRYASEFEESTVYTPGMRMAGELWRSWVTVTSPVLMNPPEVGELSIRVDGHGNFDAEFKSVQKPEASTQINIALLGMGLSTDVARGENAGKNLQHDFVVLALSTIASSKANQWQGKIPDPSIEADRYAIAAWVTEGGSLRPIQAVGGLLEPMIEL